MVGRANARTPAAGLRAAGYLKSPDSSLAWAGLTSFKTPTALPTTLDSGARDLRIRESEARSIDSA
jgi:hypothetical protein